ncbi:MAG: hypothetical protein U0973_11600 [Xanthomonadaceae bacterium]|nr:hypothetical protein [Xanthomonadaceae bacterium]
MSANMDELDYLRGVAARLSDAPHGGKCAVLADACEFLRLSRQELYRRLRQHGLFNSGRKRRADHGRCSVPEEVVRKAAGLVRMGQRANGKRTMTIKDTVPILAANGIGAVNTDTGEVTPVDVAPNTLARAMRRHGCHPDQLATPSAHTSQRSLHPNHVWQVDASVCVLFYLPAGGATVMEEKEFYKNKPANLDRVARERVIRFVITDHASSNFYLEYVLGSEDSQNLTQVFLNAIAQRGADDPMHGVPLILSMDAGSANTAGLFKNLMGRLDITPVVHLPGNPRAKGQVECHQNLVERAFEGRLPFLAVHNLAELNAHASAWRKAYCASAIHTRTKMSRNAAWLLIREEQLRTIDAELARELVTTVPVEVSVRGNLTISHSVKGHGRADYDLRHVPGVAPKQKVQVVVNPYRAPDVDVLVTDLQGEVRTYTVAPVVTDQFGFDASAPVIGERYRGMPESAIDKARTQINREAHGVDTEREVDKARRERKPAYEGQLDIMADVAATPLPHYLPRRGRELEVAAQAREEAPLNHIDAARQLKTLLGDAWTRERFGWLQQRYPEGVPPDAVAQIATELSQPGRVATVLRVVQGDAP